MDSSAQDHPEVIPLSHLEHVREAQEIIRQEAAALQELANGLSTAFSDAVRMIHEAAGSLIVTGVGKAGLIGQKLVATMASTGTRARFLHPTEAVHGDLGCVAAGDVVLALSNSGGSEEVLRLLPVLDRLNIPVIAITRDHDNPLARSARLVLPIGRHAEAGSLQLAPSVSTTTMLALGDALALVLSRYRGFTENDFALFHPAGSLGRKLCPVRDVMRSGTDFRVAAETDTVRQVLIELGRPGRRTGAVVLINSQGQLSGIFTDSDLARLFEKRREHLVDGPISAVMTAGPTTIGPDVLLPDAIHLMSRRKISELPVVDAAGIPLGLVDITDVIDCGVVTDASANAEEPAASRIPAAKSA
ncbi:MAG: KpsF/GutQ family sugar-phosphate isomerase [Fuerstiella sp.]